MSEEETKELTRSPIKGVSLAPELDGYEASSTNLAVEYWKPKEANECRRMVFVKIGEYSCLDQSNEPVKIEVAYFVQNVGGKNRAIAQGSKRLVGVFENGNVATGTPVEITYLGKKQNATNSNVGDDWSVVELLAPERVE